MEEEEKVTNIILDNINYRIIKCYYLLLDFKNLVKNPAFYVLVAIFITVLVLFFKFMLFGIQKIRISMYNELPTESKVKEETKEQLKKMKENYEKIKVEKKKKSNPPKKKEKEDDEDDEDEKDEKDTKEKKDKKSKKNKKRKDKSDKKNNIIKKRNKETGSVKLREKKKKKETETNSSFSDFYQTDYFKKVKKQNLKKGNYIDYKTTTNDSLIEKPEKKEEIDQIIQSKSDEDPNKLPFSQALREDKRKCCRVFCSLLFDKVEFLHLFTKNEYFRTILICQFLTSLVLDFFFNSFFYSDDIVSRKYHNNGNLGFLITFALSIVSALFTGIIMHYLERTMIFEEWIKQIKEIKKEYKYLYALNKFLKYLKIQIAIFFIIEISIILWGYYYICIFFIIYSQSRKSLLLNFFSSLIEGLIKSGIVIVAIVITRRVGLICKSSYIYNTSKFIDENF